MKLLLKTCQVQIHTGMKVEVSHAECAWSEGLEKGLR